MAFGDSLRFSVGLDMGPADRQLTAFGQRASKIASGVGSIAATATRAGAVMAAGLAGGAYGLKSLLSASSDMESFETQLTTIMGSASGAHARMAELFDFAASTPFNLDQVVVADKTLRGFGADADLLLPKLIDFSAALGTDLAQSAIDFGKAWNQGGVGLESDTGKILKSMIEARAGIKTADMDIQTFRQNMQDVLGDKFAGGADRLSKTFSGMMSNLEDEWSRFALQINDAGLFQNVKGALSVTLELIAQNREEIKGWATIIGGALWSAIKMVATGIAGMTDATTTLGSVFLTIKAYAALFGATVAETHLTILETIKAAAQLVGAYDAVSGDKIIDGARATAASFRETADSTFALIDSLGQGGTALSAIEGFLSAAEQAAKGMGTAMEDAAAQKAAADALASGGAGGGKDKAANDDLTARFEAALTFANDMRDLNQTETQELMGEYATRMGALLEYNRQGLITGQLFADARMGIEQNYQEQIDAMREEEVQRERERRQSLNNDVIQGTSALFGALQGLLDQNNAEQKAAYKALGIAQVAISTAIGISRSFADYGWPGGLAPAALTTATGAAQIAAIAAAHQGTAGDPVVYMHQGGGARQPSPDEMDVRKLRTEAVLNSQATRALGPQGVEAMNSGRGMAPSVVEFRMGRVAQREVIRGELRTGGSQLTRYVNETARSGDKAAGFSGGMAKA